MKWIRSLITICHLIIIGLLLANFLNAWIAPSTFSKLNFLSLAFPGLMIANIFLLLLWIIAQKKRFFLFAVTSLLLYFPIKRWVNYSPTRTADKKTIRIASFNCKLTTEEQRKKIEEYLSANEFDIINLQEAGVEKPVSKLAYSYGDELLMVTYSRYKIVDRKAVLSSEEDRQSYAIQTDVEIDGKIVRIFNIHLSSFFFNKDMIYPEEEAEANKQKLVDICKTLEPGFRKHEKQLKIISKAIRNSPYPTIVTGDMNAVPNSYEYYQISHGLNDAFVEAGTGFSTTFHDYKIPITIDYIFTSKELETKKFQVQRQINFSDHYPVVADIQLNF